jgi:hypothetical protein
MKSTVAGMKTVKLLSFWRETSQSLGIVDQPTNQMLAEELKYSHDRARRHQRPTNNLLEMWQNSAIFGGRPIGSAAIVSIANHCCFFVAPCPPHCC